MDIKVKSLYMRISPRKVRPTLFSVRGQNALNAKSILAFTNNKASKKILDLLNSAIAIAKENELDVQSMYLKTIYCNEGPRLKRSVPVSKGRATKITKRMSHLTLVISDNAETKVVKSSKSAKKEIKKTKSAQEIIESKPESKIDKSEVKAKKTTKKTVKKTDK